MRGVRSSREERKARVFIADEDIGRSLEAEEKIGREKVFGYFEGAGVGEYVVVNAVYKRIALSVAVSTASRFQGLDAGPRNREITNL